MELTFAVSTHSNGGGRGRGELVDFHVPVSRLASLGFDRGEYFGKMLPSKYFQRKLLHIFIGT